MLTPREQIASVIARVAQEHGVTMEDVLARTRIPRHERARVEAYRALANTGLPQSHIARYFGRSRATVCLALKRPPRPPAEDLQARIDDLEHRLSRITGCDLAPILAGRLDIAPWMSILLAILIEAYPRPMGQLDLLDLYEQASKRIGRGRGQGLQSELIKAFTSRVNAHMRASGIPQAVVRFPPHHLGVGDEFATWAANNIGAPFVPSVHARKLAA